nr:hypothetical protein [Sedimentibacter sp.]
MLKKIKKILKNQKGFVVTIETVAMVAVISLIIVAVGVKLYPIIIGNDGLLDKSADRITSVEDVMKP